MKNNIENILKVIKITLPKELTGEFSHRDYLGASMKAGLNRDRIGDIIVHKDKAYIIVLKENVEYIASSIKEIARFNKAKVEIINYTEIEMREQEFEEIKILVSSMRLDNIIAETIKISRGKAEELLTEEKIFINSKIETKGSKIVKEKDILVIRGKGKYIIYDTIGINKRGKAILLIKKYK